MGSFCDRCCPPGTDIDDLVYIQHFGGRFIRGNENNNGINGTGGADDYAQWHAINFDSNGTHFKYKNKMTDKYLRLHKANNDKFSLDDTTEDTAEIQFQIFKNNNDINFLKSLAPDNENKFVGVTIPQNGNEPTKLSVVTNSSDNIADYLNASKLKVLPVATIPRAHVLFPDTNGEYTLYLTFDTNNNKAQVSSTVSPTDDRAIWFTEIALFTREFVENPPDNDNGIKLRNKCTNKYVVLSGGTDIFVTGTSGVSTAFILHVDRDKDYQMLESMNSRGNFINVTSNNRVVKGSEGNNSKLLLRRIRD